uniref:Uncharacterized protein LOC105049701 n=1 Tax=Elaeis guineensis var. tenera TaxID=51953 RepID=A0A6J0PM91_ELAGV|nr:uncharacterized protein LOC105049701 [Elaeis guineensis]
MPAMAMVARPYPMVKALRQGIKGALVAGGKHSHLYTFLNIQISAGLQFSDLEDENYLSFKRKVRLENECPLKKNRVTEGNSCMLEFGDRQLSDDDSLCIKRRLKLEDDNSFKKRKITECNSDSVNKQSKLETVVPKTGFSYGCINEHGKRLREEETVPTIPSKRVC